MVRAALSEASVEDAVARVVLVDNIGVIHDGRTDLNADQLALAVPASTVQGWGEDGATVDGVVEHTKPTVLVGVSGQPGLFTESAVRAMCTWSDRPILLPLSNPTDRAEATPVDLIEWTDGTAIVATGSPFAPVEHAGVTHEIAQANNVYVFPGLALGAVAVGATAVTDAMFRAAAAAVAEATSGTGRVLPPIASISSVSRSVSIAVAAVTHRRHRRWCVRSCAPPRTGRVWMRYQPQLLGLRRVTPGSVSPSTTHHDTKENDS